MGVPLAAASFTMLTISSMLVTLYTAATLLHAGKPGPSNVLKGKAETLPSNAAALPRSRLN